MRPRTPFASVLTDSRGDATPGFVPGQQNTNTRYFADYPEDIRIYGLSFSTNLLGTSVFGEYSYRPNQAIQLATGDLIPAFALLGNAGLQGLRPTLGQDALNAALEELIRLQELVDGAAAGTGEDSATFTPGEDSTGLGTLGEDAEVATEDGN